MLDQSLTLKHPEKKLVCTFMELEIALHQGFFTESPETITKTLKDSP